MATEEVVKSFNPDEYVSRDILASPTSGDAALSVNFEDVGEQEEEVWQKTFDSDAEEVQKGVI